MARDPSEYMATKKARPFPPESEAVAGCGYLGGAQALHVWVTYRVDLGFLESRKAAQIRSRRS